MQPTIDLRSDTVTLPTPGMRRAMAEAEVGDDVYGEDPSVRRLEETVASLLGKEAALWTPTGTMANQIAIGSLVGPGEELLCERGCHLIQYEGGAVSALWGAQTFVLDGRAGIFGPAELRAALRGPDNDHFARQRAVAVENTHNRGGGTVWPIEQLESLSAAAREAGLAVHLDGARLWNAHIASGVPLSRLGACADTVSVCLSKGLGAPAGSLVATTRERVTRLRRLRKRVGGGLRQAGILAAAGQYALEHHLARLAEDHENARALAAGAAQIPGLTCAPPQTNLVVATVSLPGGVAALVQACQAEGLLCGPIGPGTIRFVTHLDVPRAAIPDAIARLRRAAANCRGA